MPRATSGPQARSKAPSSASSHSHCSQREPSDVWVGTAQNMKSGGTMSARAGALQSASATNVQVETRTMKR